MSAPTLFRDAHPLAWTYHRNTSRWATNTLEPEAKHYQAAAREYPSAPFLALPEPRPLSMSLGDAFRQRFSCRRFRTDAVLGLADLATMLHAGYGVTGHSAFGSLEFLDRPVPSGGGLYPLELYLLVRRVADLSPGVYHYAVVAHGLERLREVLVPRPLNDYLFMGQHYITDAAAIVLIAAEVERSMEKYGDRGYRYILFEAGHCAQQLNLAATALGLGSCNIGGFFDQELADLLTIDTEAVLPLYGVALGAYAPASRDELRGPRE